MMPIFKIKNKYYTRIRWVTDYNDRSEVKFPLGTDDKLVAEHRRDTIQFTSLRGKIISAYEKNSTEGVKQKE